jgi:lipid-A-disaccharide synthase
MAETMQSAPCSPLTIALVAGEASGDALGASLIDALERRFGANGAFSVMGVGGEAMEARGLASLFPQEEIAVMGILPVVKRLPILLRRIKETARHVVEAKPDLLLTIDSPDFSLRVARKVRAMDPSIPIVHWVCPSVWAWRPGRARRMRPHVDTVLCLLPFEPAELATLKGPQGVYVGHPLIERLDALRPSATEEARRADAAQPLVLLLPGSRASEISRLMEAFGAAAGIIARQVPGARFVLPAVPHLEARIRSQCTAWPVTPTVVPGEEAKLAAFRQARLALAASGTVTLELALSGVPTVAAYKVSAPEAALARRLIRVPSVILPNLILGETAVPELLQQDATPAALAEAALALLREGPVREAQLSAFQRLEGLMQLPQGTPSDAVLCELLKTLKTTR